MDNLEYKIGDLVYASDNLGINIHRLGTIIDIEPYSTEKIVIIHDGKTTTATRYCEDGSKVTATARCAPEDKFDFYTGAELAFNRLISKIEVSKYFSGTVVCIKSNAPTDLTVGKLYTFEDGVGKSDVGCKITNFPVTSVDDLNSKFHGRCKFLQVVD